MAKAAVIAGCALRYPGWAHLDAMRVPVEEVLEQVLGRVKVSQVVLCRGCLHNDPVAPREAALQGLQAQKPVSLPCLCTKATVQAKQTGPCPEDRPCA